MMGTEPFDSDIGQLRITRNKDALLSVRQDMMRAGGNGKSDARRWSFGRTPYQENREAEKVARVNQKRVMMSWAHVGFVVLVDL
ncbi:hypothetical protein W02_09400 [Nitrospira sp. KM1]|nr:hypothetical protein W02_09400 [Nitrospira sp. KM1]